MLDIVALEDVTARAWFERAAAQEHAGALERMGEFAKSGRGGPQDTAAAKAYSGSATKRRGVRVRSGAGTLR